MTIHKEGKINQRASGKSHAPSGSGHTFGNLTLNHNALINEEEDKPGNQDTRKITTLTVSMTEAQRDAVLQTARENCYTTSSFVRMLIFDNTKDLHMSRRPTADLKMLGDILGMVSALISEMNKAGSYIRNIAERLSQNNRDLFGLDGALRCFESVGDAALHTLTSIEAAITACSKIFTKKEK